MFSNRVLACAILAMGLTIDAAFAQTEFQRKELERIDVPGTQYNAVLVLVDVPGGFTVDRHTHPGIETAYILQGEVDVFVEGQPDRHLKVGETFKLGEGIPHIVRAGPPTRIPVTYVVDKNKPLASPAPK
jgi:quercetin dioxygenase-like cupin family protein